MGFALIWLCLTSEPASFWSCTSVPCRPGTMRLVCRGPSSGLIPEARPKTEQGSLVRGRGREAPMGWAGLGWGRELWKEEVGAVAKQPEPLG